MHSLTIVSLASILLIGVLLNLVVDAKEPVTKLQIGVKKRPDNCEKKSRKGDTLHVHYTVRNSGSRSAGQKSLKTVFVNF